jgi:hypothetical protein
MQDREDNKHFGNGHLIDRWQGVLSRTVTSIEPFGIRTGGIRHLGPRYTG